MLPRCLSRVETNKNPYYAAALGVLLPGLGHLYAGDRRGAIVSFLTVTTMFVVGWWLAQYRVFAFTSHPFTGRPLLAWIPIHVWPEVGNFGETAFAWIQQPVIDAERSRLLRLPIETEHIGLTLTGLSGALNFILASDACWLVARRKVLDGRAAAIIERAKAIKTRPVVSVILGWLVPGLGHVREGRKATGLVIGGCLIALYVLGLVFSRWNGVDRAQLYWLWAAQTGMGGATLILTPLLGPLMIHGEIPTFDLGTTLLAISGLLNLVVLTDVYTVAEERMLRESGILEPVDPVEETA